MKYELTVVVDLTYAKPNDRKKAVAMLRDLLRGQAMTQQDGFIKIVGVK